MIARRQSTASATSRTSVVSHISATAAVSDTTGRTIAPAPRVTARPCAAGCGSVVRRARGFGVCKSCTALAWAAFTRLHGADDPITWTREYSRLFGDRSQLLAVVRTERQMAGAS